MSIHSSKQVKICWKFYGVTIENAKINIKCKLHVSTVVYFEVTPKTEIDFVKNRFWLKIHVFLNLLFVFYAALEDYCEFLTFNSPKFQLNSLSYQKKYLWRNRSISYFIWNILQNCETLKFCLIQILMMIVYQ